MKAVLLNKGPIFLLALCSLFATTLSKANVTDAVWHCSRAQDAAKVSSEVNTEDTFQLASSGMNPDAIGITLVDLLDAYSNKPVQISGRVITACFMPGETRLSEAALKSLGLNSSSMQQLARKSAIVQSNFHLVTSEDEMEVCIRKRYPAVGYLSKTMENDWITPCF